MFIHTYCILQNLLPLSIHPHVQGPVLTEGEASLRLVHLHGGAAGVQQDSVDAAWLNVHVGQQGFKLAESAEQRFHTTTGERIRERNGRIIHLHINASGCRQRCLVCMDYENRCYFISVTSSVSKSIVIIY